MISRWRGRHASVPVQSYAGACRKDFIQIQLFADSAGGTLEDG
jgi:hypothetical protein